MDEKPFGDNPFGENPFGDIAKDNSFAKYEDDGDSGQKVCPKCGTPFTGNDYYCMNCGMTVDPVSKVVYENNKSLENYGNSGMAGHPSTVIREENRYVKMFIIGIMAVSLVFAIFCIIMGIRDATVEKVVVLNRILSSDGETVHETATIHAKGDKIYQISDEAWMDLSKMDQNQINIVVNYMNQHYERYMKYDFIKCTVTQEDKKVIAKIEYNYLNVVDNMNKLMDLQLLNFGGRKEITYKDFISLKRTLNSLLDQGWAKQ